MYDFCFLALHIQKVLSKSLVKKCKHSTHLSNQLVLGESFFDQLRSTEKKLTNEDSIGFEQKFIWLMSSYKSIKMTLS